MIHGRWLVNDEILQLVTVAKKLPVDGFVNSRDELGCFLGDFLKFVGIYFDVG